MLPENFTEQFLENLEQYQRKHPVKGYDYSVVAVCTEDGTWHSALQDQDTGKVLSPEACNLDTDNRRLEIQPQLPDWVMGIDLCARCWSTVTDR